MVLCTAVMLYDMFTPKERIFNMKEGRGNGFFSIIQSDKNKYHSVQADEKKKKKILNPDFPNIYIIVLNFEMK